MDVFSAQFWSVLLTIIVTDLVLAGDNAIVIGLAARNLPRENQKKAIVLGTCGAIVVRSVLTLVVVWLLRIPGLLLVGGLLLIRIAYKLLVEEKGHDNMKSGDSLLAAIKTIIVADAVMGLDNVLAVAGAAHGSFFMVVLGLLISVPIVVWGSTIILKWIERFPAIIYIGAGVLAWTSSKMIAEEPFLKSFFEEYIFIKWALELVIVLGVLFAGRMKKRKSAKELGSS
ncbi:TerC family protein [Clostridium aminobutyricum]|uniref:TerC family protein n=1 Tax=Clostridium aminobutyricum TaxID=33953 RepID=A0A939D858_CLOAM|nr:TerC family protein [Clostridium aminobutyricum]MBN7773259.1 TerC family protein [Clostridium aminobutyricum]